MNIQRMRRAELIALVEQLNEARDHTDRVIDWLRTENDVLKSRVAEHLAEFDRLYAQLASRSPVHPKDKGRVHGALVHEFNPDVPGSYVQAMQRAREQGGVVRRTRP